MSEEQKVVNTEATETPVQETPKGTTPELQTEQTQTPSGEVVKETPKEVSTDKVPYSRFSEVISHKNEALRRAEVAETKLREYESRQPQSQEPDPFAGLQPEEREQTEKFIDKFVAPKVRKEIMREFAPYLTEMHNDKLNKQIGEAKSFAEKVGVNFDERLPEVVDFLSRPENKGRLTAKEAILSLYGDEILEKTRFKAKEEVSQETKELMEKKKIANMTVTSVNPNSVVHSDEMARKGMSTSERLNADIKWAMEQTKLGVRNPKVRTE